MSELRTRGKALVEAAPAASPAVELERSASQSSLLMPSKPVKGRKRSSSNVGQRCVRCFSHALCVPAEVA